MRSRVTLPVLMALAVTITACQGGTSMLSEEDVAGIREVQDAWLFHVRQADWVSLMVVYTEDAIVMPANGPAIEGRQAIQEFMQAFPTITEVDLTIEEIDGRGDLAFVRGTYTMTLEPEGAPEPIQDRGKYIEIRRRQADGAWLLAVDIFNSDLPLPDSQP